MQKLGTARGMIDHDGIPVVLCATDRA